MTLQHGSRQLLIALKCSKKRQRHQNRVKSRCGTAALCSIWRTQGCTAMQVRGAPMTSRILICPCGDCRHEHWLELTCRRQIHLHMRVAPRIVLMLLTSKCRQQRTNAAQPTHCPSADRPTAAPVPDTGNCTSRRMALLTGVSGPCLAALCNPHQVRHARAPWCDV